MSTPANAQEFSDEDYEVLRIALNIARNQQVRRLATLRLKLLQLLPGREASIERALRYWANYEAQKRSLDAMA